MFTPLEKRYPGRPRPEDSDDKRLGEILKIWQSGDEIAEILPEIDEKTFVIWGYGDDRGVDRNGGRTGSAEAPDEIRRYLYNFAIPHPKFLSDFKIVDLGNFRSWSLSLHEAHKLASEIVPQLRQTGARLITLGGGHDWAGPDFKGFADGFGGERKHIINFDAHLDMRPLVDDPALGEHSGTPFRQILSDPGILGKNTRFSAVGLQRHCNAVAHIQWAEGHRVTLQFIEELSLDLKEQWLQISERLGLEKPQGSPEASDIYGISVDMDCFAQSVSPGVSAPQAFGLDPRIVQRTLQSVGKKTRQLGIYECNPRYDSDGASARLAARIAFEYMHSCV